MCDLDGTLIGKGHTTNEADKAALRKARESGMMISICTGRSWRESRHLIADLQLEVPGVFSNGAELNWNITGNSIEHVPLSDREMEVLLPLCRERSLTPIMLLHQHHPDDPLYLVEDMAKLHPATTDWFRRNGVSHLISTSADESLLKRCVRVGLIMDEPSAAEFTAVLERDYGDQFSYHLLQALHFQTAILEIFHRGVNKWSGILRLCVHLGVDPRDVVTIGDDVNDIPMLENAHLSYAMGSAPEHVRSSAKKTTLAHAQSGVAAAVADLFHGQPVPIRPDQGMARYSNFGLANE